MIKILYDNSAIDEFKADWGFSALINDSILFDTGAKPDILEYNMILANIEYSKIKYVVISHKHWDHAGGLDLIIDKCQNIEKIYIPSDFDTDYKNIIINNNELIKITDNVAILPELKTTYKNIPLFEQAIVIENEDELMVITGCAHPGIIKIFDQVSKLFKNKKISAIGGFHLHNLSKEKALEIANKLKKMGLSKAGPCHCSGPAAKSAFSEIFGKEYIVVDAGRTIKF